MWQVILARQAVKDARRIAQAGLQTKAVDLLAILARDPFQTPPPCEKLVGNLAGFYSRRITLQHRLVYRVDQDLRVVHVLRMWTHYE